MDYFSTRIHLVKEPKRKNFKNSNWGKNCIEIPAFRVVAGLNYMTLVETENQQGRFYYITGEEIKKYPKPYKNKNEKSGYEYEVFAPPLDKFIEIPIDEIDLYAFTKEEYDIKESKHSKIYRDVLKIFKNTILMLIDNGKDISKLPLNIVINNHEDIDIFHEKEIKPIKKKTNKK